MSGLNENHRRALAAAFKHIDDLLVSIETACAAPNTPFARRFADLSPTQERVIADYVARLRGQMTDAVKALGIPIEPPRTAASWAIQTAVSFAQIGVQEISPSRLNGYGPVDAEAAAALERLEADLERTLQRLQTYLAQGLGKDLSARLERLERAPVDLTLVQRLERMVTQRGLIEFRGALEALVERIEADTFEIAVFGRVSSGKSSLLNTVLGFAALPVGVTPVTAVPTRLVWGERPSAEIRFADAPSEEIALERLKEYVSEEHNPENRKRVTRALAKLPSAILARGVVFVDTPGVGSLATAGARESYAYLPRCDLGVLLIDAASAPTREDLEILRLLDDSGIPGKVVVSKADLLSEADRVRMRDYVRTKISNELGLELPVRLVCAVGPGAALAREWFQEEIEPLTARARELAQASARRKLASLEAEGLLQEAGRRCEALAEEARNLARPTLELAAREYTRLLANGGAGPWRRSTAGSSWAAGRRSLADLPPRRRLLSSPPRGNSMKHARGISIAVLTAAFFFWCTPAAPGQTWSFVVGGDSRNCGDVVMPAVAAGAASARAAFYWHLGDYRWMYDFDQDILAQPERRNRGGAGMTISEYQKGAWDDFIQSQVVPFGSTPVFLAIGNHELVSPKTRADYLLQFADWLNAPEIQRQRLKDDPKDHLLETWYHWVRGGVDFITLDNASHDQFDAEQLSWFESVIKRDEPDPSVTTLVVGMHCALPDSLASSHSMSDWHQGRESGRQVYEKLLEARDRAGKKVYVLASHSHFYMSGIFDTPYWRAHGGVLPGWIIGTTGAHRYALPKDADKALEAKTNVYGYLLATVAPDGSIRFEFREIKPDDLPAGVTARYGAAFIRQCFEGNRNTR